MGYHDIDLIHQGGQAVEQVRVQPPERVFIDIGLPDISGFEVARQLREHYGSDLTLIALSGYSRDQIMANAGGEYFDHYLLKPARAAQLLQLLR